jgi:hypothetical protein
MGSWPLIFATGGVTKRQQKNRMDIKGREDSLYGKFLNSKKMIFGMN